jgi:hypothetical protein
MNKEERLAAEEAEGERETFLCTECGKTLQSKSMLNGRGTAQEFTILSDSDSD